MLKILFLLPLFFFTTSHTLSQISLKTHIEGKYLVLNFVNNSTCSCLIPFSLANLDMHLEKYPTFKLIGIDTVSKELFPIGFSAQINWEKWIEELVIPSNASENYAIRLDFLDIQKEKYQQIVVFYSWKKYKNCAGKIEDLNLKAVTKIL